MTTKTLNALKASIAHWRRHETGKAKPEEGIGPFDCALCDLFIKTGSKPCRGCPVAIKTGEAGCHHTPYYDAFAADQIYGRDSTQFRLAAKAERKFLESLLPKRKAKP